MITTSSFQILLTFTSSRKLQKRLLVSSEKPATINIKELEVLWKAIFKHQNNYSSFNDKGEENMIQADLLLGLLFPADLFKYKYIFLIGV